MKNLIEEDKNVILIKLLEETTWINKTDVATKLAIKENDKKEERTNEELVPKNSMNTWTFLMKKRPTNSLNLDLEITRLR